MSLVEEAMKKLQQAQRAAAASSEADRGTVRVAGQTFGTPPGALRPVPAVPIRSDRLVSIDLNALREAGLAPPQDQERRIAQQYRQIKRPLIANATGRDGPRLPNGTLIMIASAVPGEGKTFTSLNLAMSMTLERDARILLVDADLPKPHISDLLGVRSEPGLLNALRDSTLDVESLILPTSIPSLFVLPAGHGAEDATELLASDRMREVCTRLIERDTKRFVIFDSAPLLLTTESQALAQVVGQIVIVVRAGQTPHRTVLDAIDSLGSGKSVSLILNQSTDAPPSNYYYNYGYGEAGARKPPDTFGTPGSGPK